MIGELLQGNNSTTLLQGGIIITIITFLFTNLKSIPIYIWNKIKSHFIYTLYIDESDELYIYFELWLNANYKTKYRTVEGVLAYNGQKMKLKDDYTNQTDKDINTEYIHYKQYSDSFFIKYKNKNLYIFKGREKLENASSYKQIYLNNFRISGIFAKEDITNLMNEVLFYNHKLQKENNIIKIYSSDEYGRWYRLKNKQIKHINNVFIKQNIKAEIIADIDNFINSKQWYYERSLIYKRGYGFYGLPGNGKTSLCFAISEYLKRNIYFISSNIKTDDALIGAIREIDNTNAILVFEDIDTLFEKSNISHSTLLNCLDGALSSENLIVIITTNHIDKIQSNLLRSGRIDKKFEISNPDNDIILEYLKNFYNKNDIKFDFDLKNKIPMSEVQNICLQNKNNYINTINEFKKIEIESN